MLIGRRVLSRYCRRIERKSRRDPGPRRRRKNEGGLRQLVGMEEPTSTPEYILEYDPREKRVIKVEANVVAYFGDLFHALRSALTKADGASSVKAK